MQVNKWGPSGWTFLHTITFNYPENPTNEDKLHYSHFFNLLGVILPCKYCQASFTIYAKYIPIDDFLNDREGIIYWLFVIHNLINAKLGAKFEFLFNVYYKYEQLRAKCGKMTNDNKIQILTCQKNLQNVDVKKIKQICTSTHDKYFDKMCKYITILYNSPDNPNKPIDQLCNSIIGDKNIPIID
jgi:hypothetical protein